MVDPQTENIAWTAGGTLILCILVQFPGLIMFWLRNGMKGGQPQSRGHFIWERSFIMGSVILGAIGFVVLAGALQNQSGFALGLMGAASYFIGAILIVAAEALSLTIGFEKMLPIVNIYVLLAFLAQAVIGGALLESSLTAAWVGWVCIVWNVGWLVAIPLLSPREMYYAILHSVMPLLIGIALLVR